VDDDRDPKRAFVRLCIRELPKDNKEPNYANILYEYQRIKAFRGKPGSKGKGTVKQYLAHLVKSGRAVTGKKYAGYFIDADLRDRFEKAGANPYRVRLAERMQTEPAFADALFGYRDEDLAESPPIAVER
jgi:hypothetical protein